MNRRTLAGPALLLALAMPLAACGSGSDDSGGSSASTKTSAHGVTVSGDFGSKPSVDVDAPLHLKKSSSFVSIKGDGDKLENGQAFVLDLTLVDGQSGKTLISTYDKGQVALGGTVGQSNIFPVLQKAITGKDIGSRVVIEATSDDAYGSQGNSQLGVKAGDPVVMVADLVATNPQHVLDGPKGTKEKPPADAPTLKTGKDGVPTGFDFAGATKPKGLKAYTLIKGTGPKVGDAGVVTVNYLGSVWGSKKVFDASYPRKQTATFPIGVGSVIKGWDEGLKGIPVGSRVLLVCPPDLAYGPQGSPPTIPKNATLAFVVDVLGAS